jgi:hypothetical protein
MAIAETTFGCMYAYVTPPVVLADTGRATEEQ